MFAESVKITILADNSALPPLKSEHGFSCFVEIYPSFYKKASEKCCLNDKLNIRAKPFCFLFDTGRGVIFENSKILKKNIFNTNAIVLSHGHYDHSDALYDLFAQFYDKKKNPPSLYASNFVTNPHFSKSTGSCREIGLSKNNLNLIKELKAKNKESSFKSFVGVDYFLPLAGGMAFLSGNILRKSKTEKKSPFLFSDKECKVQDNIDDEIYLAIKTKKGLVIITGCCHSGFINTVNDAKQKSGGLGVKSVIGGLHLAGVGDKQLNETANFVLGNPGLEVFACHCTGKKETEYLSKKTNSLVKATSCGEVHLFYGS